MENNTQNNEVLSEKEIRNIKKNNRLFILFLAIDLVIVGLIIYEIIALILGLH